MARDANLLFRVPRDTIQIGRAYVIHARNGGVGVAVEETFLSKPVVSYRLRRVKFSKVFLDDEIDWADDESYGTAIPLRLLDEIPPTEPSELLRWLEEQEQIVKSETDAAWERAILSKKV